ncbi:MAG TPA: PAS domain-containing protein [Xanthobacteraceae bacterium]
MNNEHRIAEEAVRESEQRWRSLTEALPQLVWSAAPDGACDYFSTQWTEYTGVAESELLGWRWMDVLHPDDRESTRQFWTDSVAGRRAYDVEYRVRRHDGAYGWFKTRGGPIRDSNGDIVKWFGTCTDITDGKRAEEALRESEQRWRSLTEALPQLVWSATPDGACDYFSTRWTEYTGVAESELLGWRWMGVLHPDDRESTRQFWTDSVAGRRAYDVEYRVRRHDGAYGWFKTRGVPIRDSNGDIVKWFGTCTDITDGKRAEEALRHREQELRKARNELEKKVAERTAELRRSEAYLAEAQRLSHTGSWALTPARGEIRYWSEECFRVLGFDPEGAPPRFETFFQRLHPDDRPGITEVLERATRERTDFTLDCRIIHAGGRIRDIHVAGHPVFSASGDLAEFVGTVIDVTERKQADEERQAHLWFLESMDKVNRGIQGTNDLEQMMSDVLDAVLSIVACDRAWLVYPCDPEATSWRAAMEHTRPDYPGAFALGIDLPMDAEVADVFQTARASSGAVQFNSKSESPVPAQLGERFGIQSLIAMAVYPKVDKPYMFGLHQCSYPRVWTAREERLFQEVGRRLGDALTGLLMLRNLRESEGNLEEAQRIAHIGHWDHDLDTDRYNLSDEAYRIFGLRPREKSITSAVLQELIHPEDWESTTLARMSALRGGPPYDVECRVVWPNGEVRVVHSRGDVTRDESGRPRRRFGTVQDITERKRAEDDLRKSERRYREAQSELAHVNRVTTMGQLTATIAHEVNQPIAAAVTNADAGLRWLAAQPPNLEEVRDAFDHIIKASNQASEVVGRIRALIKKLPARKASLDINETILETIALTRSEMRRHCILLQTELANGLPRIWGDRVQLQQVILNLIMNAIEAMSEVSEGSRELLIDTGLDAPDGVLVAVRDSGPGLKPESLDHLFDPFYTTKPAGMGMGLSICRSITEAHGGRLWATANAPRGAVFQFTVHQDDAS